MKIRIAIFAAILLSGCTSLPNEPARPADAFFARLSAHCGKAYAGRVVSTDPADADFANKPLVMHVRHCTPGEVRIPFHVGSDRSRTWVVTRTAAGLRLKHDHRHQDGNPDALTNYGGDTVAPGTAVRQLFPADAESRALFDASGRSVSNANVWALEVGDALFAYELRRPQRFFRVEFDLGRPVAPPPPPWGG
jgi:hypothetical protein